MNEFKPFYTTGFVEKLNSLDHSVKELAEKKILKILDNPFAGKPLHGEPFLFNERFADSKYRIVYKIEGNLVRFLRVGKRDNVYR